MITTKSVLFACALMTVIQSVSHAQTALNTLNLPNIGGVVSGKAGMSAIRTALLLTHNTPLFPKEITECTSNSESSISGFKNQGHAYGIGKTVREK